MTDRELMQQAYAVPLHEQLASVPENARLEIHDPDGMGTRFFAVGRMCHEAATILCERLVQPKRDDGVCRHCSGAGCVACDARHLPEPVAWRTFDGEGGYDYRDYDMNENYRDEYIKRNGTKYASWVEPLYTAPQRREWMKMTDAEIFTSLKATFGDDVKLTPGFMAFARAIEAKLKEKNT